MDATMTRLHVHGLDADSVRVLLEPQHERPIDVSKARVLLELVNGDPGPVHALIPVRIEVHVAVGEGFALASIFS
jgi:hypothetical protein